MEYQQYLEALKIVKQFRAKINNDYNNIVIIKKNNPKDKVFEMLSIDINIRTIEIANHLKLSRQLVHKYKKQYFIKKIK